MPQVQATRLLRFLLVPPSPCPEHRIPAVLQQSPKRNQEATRYPMICQNPKRVLPLHAPGSHTSAHPHGHQLGQHITSARPARHTAGFSPQASPRSPAGLTPPGASSLPGFYFQPPARLRAKPQLPPAAALPDGPAAALPPLPRSAPTRWQSPIPLCSPDEPALILCSAAATAPADSIAAEAAGLRDTLSTWVWLFWGLSVHRALRLQGRSACSLLLYLWGKMSRDTVLDGECHFCKQGDVAALRGSTCRHLGAPSKPQSPAPIAKVGSHPRGLAKPPWQPHAIRVPDRPTDKPTKRLPSRSPPG